MAERTLAADMTATVDLAAALAADRPLASAMTATADLAASLSVDRNLLVALSSTADLGAVLSVDRNFAAALAATIDALASFTTSDLTTEDINRILDSPFEGGYTIRDVLKLAIAHAAGRQVVSFGQTTATVTYRDIPDTLNRLTFTLAGGARTAVDKDLS